MQRLMIIFGMMVFLIVGCTKEDSQTADTIEFTLVGINDDQFLLEIEGDRYFTEDSSELRMIKLETLFDEDLNLSKSGTTDKTLRFRGISKNEDRNSPYIVHLGTEDLRVRLIK